MNDVIPGATYYDGVFEECAVCNGTFENDGNEYVKFEYIDRGVSVAIDYDSFRNADGLEIIALP